MGPPWTVPGALAVLIGCAVSVGCSGGGDTAGPVDDGTASKSLTETRNGELVAYVRGRSLESYDAAVEAMRQGEFVTAPPLPTSPPLPLPAPAPVAAPAPATTQPTALPDGGAGADGFGSGTTTVQEAGVDEADRLKSDGRTIFSLADEAAGTLLQIDAIDPNASRATPPALTRIAALRLPDGERGIGLYLSPSSSRVAVLSAPSRRVQPIWSMWSSSLFWLEQRTMVSFFDALTPAATRPTHRITVDGALVDSRRIDDTLYLVTRSAIPMPGPVLPLDDERIRGDRAKIDSLTAADILPSVRVDGGPPAALVAEADCFVQGSNGLPGVDVITITALRIGSDGLDRTSRCFAGGSDVLYLSRTTLYLATTGRGPIGSVSIDPDSTPVDRVALDVTHLHKFAVDGLAIAYRGSGSVPGRLGWQSGSYRLAESGGDLRVVTDTADWLAMTGPPAATEPGVVPGTGTGTGTGTAPVGPSVGASADGSAWPVRSSPATLSILRELAGQSGLALVGQLPNRRRPDPLGKPGERVYATRFTATRGYLVTFRQTDPLYVLDLTDAADPTQAGELEMPGFSNYLFPVSDRLLFGIGRSGPTWPNRVRASLVDVGTLSAPRELDALELGAAGSLAAVDVTPHGIVFQRAGNDLRAALGVAASVGDGLRRALHRLQIDTVAGRLSEQPAIDAPPPGSGSTGWPAFEDDRAVLIGDQVHYLSDGRFASGWW